jgi:quercetin dioxygenase-like cupin family protein
MTAVKPVNNVRAVLMTCLAAALGLGCWSVVAQEAAPTNPLLVFGPHDLPWTPANTSHFSGKVDEQRLMAQSGNIRIARVRFQPGARTNWHRHAGGQVLYIESGHGLVQTESGSIREVNAGDVVYTAPGELHWHGAAEGSDMTHVAVSVGETEWRGRADGPERASAK